MKLLLDECIPRRLRFDFPGHEVLTVEQAGLKGLKNGALIREANNRFEVLVTVDQNLPFQQNIAQHSIAVLILVSSSNRYSDLKLLVLDALHTLDTIKAGGPCTNWIVNSLIIINPKTQPPSGYSLLLDQGDPAMMHYENQ